MVTPLPHNFHEGGITDWRIGPRRELILWIAVAMPKPGQSIVIGQPNVYRLRFGAIENFEEVRALFGPDSQWHTIGSLTYDKNETSRPNRLFFRFAMMGGGDPVLVIRCRNFSIVQETPDLSSEVEEG